MSVLLVDFSAEFQARFASVAAAHEITVDVQSADDRPGGSFENGADVLLLAFPPRASRFKRLRQIREHTDLPMIVLADHPDHVDSVVALELGADEYLPRTCEPRELMAHVQALLRRRRQASNSSSNRLDIDGFSLDIGTREVYVDGDKIDLTTTELGLLRTLMECAGRTVSRNELHRRLTSQMNIGPDRAVDVHISHLRKKLGKRRRRIKTLRGAGYQFLTGTNT